MPVGAVDLIHNLNQNPQIEPKVSNVQLAETIGSTEPESPRAWVTGADVRRQRGVVTQRSGCDGRTEGEQAT